MLFLLNTSVTPDRNQTVVALLQEAHVLEIQSDVASRSHLNQKFTLRLHLHALTKTLIELTLCFLILKHLLWF